jgi:hypothetical protein
LNDNIWINVVGGLVVTIPVIEVFSGVAWETLGLVHRDERPRTFWFSVTCKFAVGVAILNIEYLQATFGR